MHSAWGAPCGVYKGLHRERKGCCIGNYGGLHGECVALHGEFMQGCPASA